MKSFKKLNGVILCVAFKNLEQTNKKKTKRTTRLPFFAPYFSRFSSFSTTTILLLPVLFRGIVQNLNISYLFFLWYIDIYILHIPYIYIYHIYMFGIYISCSLKEKKLSSRPWNYWGVCLKVT